jgi:hypothetical protein
VNWWAECKRRAHTPGPWRPIRSFSDARKAFTPPWHNSTDIGDLLSPQRLGIERRSVFFVLTVHLYHNACANMERLRESCVRADSYPHNLIVTQNLTGSLDDYLTRLNRQRGRIFVKDGKATLNLLDLHANQQGNETLRSVSQQHTDSILRWVRVLCELCKRCERA